MNVDGIRNAFSKGSVAITHDGILVFYTHKDSWVSQSIFNDNMRVFQDLVSHCDGLIIKVIKGEMVKLGFGYILDNQDTVFYSPVEREVSIDELRNVANDINNGDNAGFFDFFMGVDLDDNDAILEKLRDFFVQRESERKTNMVDIPRLIRWRKVHRLAVGFANLAGFSCETSEPGDGFDGSVTIQFPEEFDKPITISGNLKKSLEELLDASSGVGIECNIPDGFLDMTFYN